MAAELQPNMPSRETGDLAIGTPVFRTDELRQIAAAQGNLAAWRAAFASQGASAPADVEGPFAVVVRAGDGTVYLAIDRFAICTLCFRRVGDSLHVAQRADELVDPDADAEIDLQAIFDYLFFHVIPSPRTIFKGVHRLPPGHCAVFTGSRLQVSPYWSPVFATGDKKPFSRAAA